MAQTEEVRKPELRHRVLAAAGASVVSALLVNPLDVVKTRVQAASIVTDRPLPSCLLTRTPSRFPVRWSRPSSLSDCQSKLPAGPAMGASCMGGGGGLGQPASQPHHLPRQPLLGQLPMSSCACSLKVSDLGPGHLGASENCHNARLYRPVTASGVLRDIVGKEGVAALWRGTDTAMLASIPMVGVYMPLYDYLLQRAVSSGQLGGYAPLLAGSAARTLAVLLVGPLELVRTRQQGSAGAARTAWGAVRETLRDTGAAGGRAAAAQAPEGAGVGMGRLLSAAPRLWTGVGATLARDVPFSAIYWGLVERIRGELLMQWQVPVPVPATASSQSQAVPSFRDGLPPQQEQQRWELQQHQQHHEEEHRPVSPSSRSAVLTANLIAGSIAGAVAALVTTPFDVVKTQLQVGDVRGGGGGGGSGSGGRVSGLEVARRVLREEGAGGLFRGWAPRVARTAPACAVVVASYEVLKMMI